LGVDAPISGGGAGGKLDKRWAQIWVRQGLSGQNPSGELEDHRSTLISRLQAMGGAGAVQSELDNRIHQGLKEKLDGLLKAQDQPKAGTPLHGLEEKLKDLRLRETVARSAVASLEGAVAQMDEAEELITEKTAQYAQVRERLEEARKRHAQAQALQATLRPILLELQNVEQEVSFIQRHIEEISQASAALPQLQAAQSQTRTQAAITETSVAEAATLVAQHDEQLAAIRGELENAQQRLATSRAQKELLQQERQVGELEKQHRSLTKQKESLDVCRTDLQCLPQITPKALAKLRALHQAKLEAESVFKAIATRVQVLAADSHLRIQGKAVEPGSDESFSGAFEIKAGDFLHLRITPGGGESLSDAIAQRDEALRTFEEALKKAEASTLEEAEIQGSKRSELESKIRILQEALDASGWDDLNERLGDAQRDQAAAEARLGRLQQTSEAWTLASDEKTAIADEEEAATVCSDLKVRIKGLESSRVQSSLQHQKRTDLHIDADTRAQSANIALVNAQAFLAALEQTHGGAAEMAVTEGKLKQRVTELQKAKMETEQALTDLRSDEVESEIGMLTASYENHQTIIQQKREQKAAAAAVLQSAGTTDPVGDLNEIIECKREVETQHAVEMGRVRALQHLVCLFDDLESALEQAFTQPLLEKVGGYMTVVFGAGAKAEARYRDGRFDGLALNRSSQGLGTHGFDQLSGGAREQLGVAFRLAVAEILAAEHDGCLPLVLDDAFANSDPERVKALQLMIHRATQRGLQIILLTCTPADYSGLGGNEIRLPRPRPNLAAASAMAVEVEMEEAEAPVPAESIVASPSVQSGDDDILLAALRATGGRSGNQSLRNALAWDEVRYESVKNSLWENGKIEKGKGKGGSVQIL